MINIKHIAWVAQKLRGYLTNTLVRNTGIYMFGNILPQLINLLLLPVFTRHLSSSEYGILSYTTALTVFLFVVGSLSIHSYVLRHYFECKTEEEKQSLFGTVFSFLVIYNMALLGAEFVIFPIAFSFLEIQVPFYPYVSIALFNNFIEILSTIPLVYYRVRQEANRFVFLALSQMVLGTVFSLYLVINADLGVLGRYYGLLGANTIMMVIYLFIIFRISRLTWDLNQLKLALVFSIPLFPAAFFNNLSGMSDRLILERYVSLSQMGIYSVGFSIASGLSFLSNSIYRAIEPEIYRMASNSNFNEKTVHVKQFLVMVLLGIGFTMICFSKEILMLLAPNFIDSYTIIALITVALVIQGIALPAGFYLVALYQTRFMPFISFTSAGVNIGVNLLLVPKIGIYGSAIGAIIASMVTLGICILITERISGIRWHYGRDLIMIIATSLLGFFIMFIETPFLVGTIAVKAGLFVVFSILLVWVLFKLNNDIKKISYGE